MILSDLPQGQRDGETCSVMLRAEKHFTVYPPVKATKPQMGCANKVKEPVPEEMPRTAREASTLEMKPDAGLKVLGWIPKRHCAFLPLPRGWVSSCQALCKEQRSGVWRRGGGGAQLPRPLPTWRSGNHDPDLASFPWILLLLRVCLQDSMGKAVLALREEPPHVRFLKAVVGAPEWPGPWCGIPTSVQKGLA